jgi:Leg1
MYCCFINKLSFQRTVSAAFAVFIIGTTRTRTTTAFTTTGTRSGGVGGGPDHAAAAPAEYTSNSNTITGNGPPFLPTRAFDWDAWQRGQGTPPSRGDPLAGTCFASYWEDLPAAAMITRPAMVDNNNATDDNTPSTSRSPLQTIVRVRGDSFRSRMSAIRCLIGNSSSSAALLEQDESGSSSLVLPAQLLSLPLINEPRLLWGPNHVHHWLWAFGAQLDWQHRSGRLRVTTADSASSVAVPNDDRHHDHDEDWISDESWWGFMNFGFSVAVLAGAVQAYNEAVAASALSSSTTTPNSTCHHHAGSPMLLLLVVEDTASQQLLLTPPMQDCVHTWKQLFAETYPLFQRKIDTALEKQQQQQEPQQEPGRLSDSTLARLRFELQQHVWQAHIQVLDRLVPSPAAATLRAKLPGPDAKFGAGWARMVEILAASRFPTDLVTLVRDGAGFLPAQIVTNEYMTMMQQQQQQQQQKRRDEPVTTSDTVRARQFRSVQVTHEIVGTSDATWARVAAFWRRVVRDPKTARSMPGRVNRLVHGSLVIKITTLVNTLWLFLKP